MAKRNMMERIYNSVIKNHLRDYNQMVILTGPSSVGKAALCNDILGGSNHVLSLNWDNIADRELILSGAKNLLTKIKMDPIGKDLPIIILDGISHYREWKNLLKGYFDVLSGQCRFIVISNEKVNIYRSGQDSMMGRYFSYQIHPLTTAELCQHREFSREYSPPKEISDENWNKLIKYGGFPEPFLRSTKRFHSLWSRKKRDSFINVEAREQAKISDLQLFNLLIELLQRNVGQLINFSNFARAIQTTVPTVQHWYEILNNYYYCFSVLPWAQGIKRALQKAPKNYFYDWSQIPDKNKRIENFVACHLQKSVDFWNDKGLGSYDIFYLRDKDKHEVDFLITKNGEPWIMIDVSTGKALSQSLLRFQNQLKVPHVFQLSQNLPYVNKDCFSSKRPVIAPMKTFLSQLV